MTLLSLFEKILSNYAFTFANEITLLSNGVSVHHHFTAVLLPYEITLLSNFAAVR